MSSMRSYHFASLRKVGKSVQWRQLQDAKGDRIKMMSRTVQVIKANKASAEDVLRVAAYCRVSTDSEDQLNSFIAQMHYYYSFIQQAENMTLVDIYADEGITGTSLAKRDDFNRMIRDSKAGKIDRIYVKSVPRFARNALDCLENIRILKDCGVSVFFENDGIDTQTLNSELVLYVKSAFAQAEAMAGSKRVRTANRMRLEGGHYTFKTPPFGYRMENNTLIPIAEEAEIVIRIYKEYLSGMGVSKIVSGLNSDPFVPRKPWTKEGVRYILSNEKYIGDSMFQKSFTPSELPFRNRLNRGEVDKYYIAGTHEPIMDKELHSAVQEMLRRNAEKNAQKAKSRKFNFSNRIFCSSCGWAYKRRVQNGIIYWVCGKDGISGQRCDTKPISEEAFCKTFVNFYNRLRLHENMILRSTVTRLSEIKKVITCSDSKIGDIDRIIGELVQQHSMYQALNEQKMMDDITYAEASAKTDRQLAKLRDQRKNLLREDDDERSIDEIRQLRNSLESAPKAILMFDQDLFKLLVDRVTVEAGDILTFTLKGGMRLREAIAWN